VEEGMDRGETNIAAAGGVAATLLEMIEEPSNERGIQICQGRPMTATDGRGFCV